MEEAPTQIKVEKLTVVEDATSSSEVGCFKSPTSLQSPATTKSPESPPGGPLDSSALKQQLFHQHLILQQIQLQQLQNSSFDEQVKTLLLLCALSQLAGYAGWEI